jgi:hypothetical protein
LKKAQQHQILGKTRFFNASSDILPVIADALDSIFSQVVVPRHAIMLQEREEALAISQQSFL